MSDSTIFPFNSSMIDQSADSNVSSSSSNSNASDSSVDSHSFIESNSDSGPNTSVESQSSAESDSSVDSSLERPSPVDRELSVESGSSSASNTSESSSDGEASNQLHSPQSNSSLNMANLSVSNEDAHAQIRSLTQDVIQMEADLDRMNRYCEDVVSQIDDFATRTSTPTVARRIRRRTNPVEVIDLSHLEHAPPVRSARNRDPDAVIDLCTPEGPRRRTVNSIFSNDSLTIPPRRRGLSGSTENVPVVDLDVVSPPKRANRDMDVSQKEDLYKCPVCIESVSKREPVSTKCGHVFCRECIEAAIRATHKCPICNKKLTVRQFFRIYL
ncbi:E3 ubiquitin-protein ligase complex slx8-rfp subunit rfp2 isoform X1 [Drosophila mauritiana]|uniref:E3 ubiquitin-protein ligase complex slx8-rfp subunit rfp2 isoform X1 n=2 Tax=Drosophila mauritiana TaxID=7226 RepID=A0A6P8KEI6_DROMA|nr:E3 ubiquitin-protein ligase complex slx8-rfp subunit rfp2 isoform X1 [Drosophila mauritiana]